MALTLLGSFRCANRLRGTRAGANNRMDLLSLVTSGVNDGEVSSTDEDILGVVEGWQEDETHNPDVPAVTHKRGLTPFVFIPFEEVYGISDLENVSRVSNVSYPPKACALSMGR